jgi:hypothetical protein
MENPRGAARDESLFTVKDHIFHWDETPGYRCLPREEKSNQNCFLAAITSELSKENSNDKQGVG